MNVELIKAQQNYIQEQVKIEALRSAYLEGENSGECEPWDVKQIIAQAKQEINA